MTISDAVFPLARGETAMLPNGQPIALERLRISPSAREIVLERLEMSALGLRWGATEHFYAFDSSGKVTMDAAIAADMRAMAAFIDDHRAGRTTERERQAWLNAERLEGLGDERSR